MEVSRYIFSTLCFCGLVHGAAATTWYVATSGNDSAARTNWATAKLTTQGAVSVATNNGDTVLVSNGVYQTGGRVFYGSMTNRAAITNGLTNPDDCAAGDGYPNLLKYATGSSPTSSVCV